MTVLDPRAAETTLAPYRAAFLDWLACAYAGRDERAVRALRAVGTDLPTRVAVAAAAGHVLDFDDTFSDGIAHVSAACAPAALVLAAHLGQPVDAMLAAYAQGFEAMAAVAQASHPALYDGGWHPTAVCGPVGAAVAAAHLLDLSVPERETALAAALLRAGGTRGAFGSDGKAIQVAIAAAAGVQGALLAQGGAVVDSRAIHGPLGVEGVLHAVWATPGTRPAIARNWVKLHPSCLGTHAPIEAAEEVRRGRDPHAGPLEVVVHPVARQAAHLDAVGTGLEAKFSIPYCVAYTLRHGPPAVRAFAALDPDATTRSAEITVTVDPAQPQFGAVVRDPTGGQQLARVPSPTGSPERPATAADLEAKLRDLDATRLIGALDDPAAPARDVLEAVGLA